MAEEKKVTRASIIDPLLVKNETRENIVKAVLAQRPQDDEKKIKVAISTRKVMLTKKGEKKEVPGTENK